MPANFPLLPPQASTVAQSVDTLYLFLVALTAFFSILIAAVATYFGIRYRRRAVVDRSNPPHHNTPLELLWSGIPLVISMEIFVWSADLFFKLNRPPDGAMEIHVLAKRWMWKTQHLNGRREVNELHVPAGRPIRLTMTSEDVIHSFYVPAFRIKQDVLPGRYVTAWFEATTPGAYHLFCAEYCGTKHSRMIGSIIVMEPDAFQAWLGGETTGQSAAQAGETLFRNYGCVTCHNPDSRGRGPSLDGLYGREVRLEGGGVASADEEYLRESILNPNARRVEGYQPLMPTFQGLLSEEGILQIIEYIKSTGAKASTGGAEKAES